MNKREILNIITDYLNDIHIFMKYFKEKYHREDVLRAWHERSIPKEGNVTDEIEYELHGAGCCILFPDREVDFDFGPNSRFDGFDLWRLKRYLKQRPNLTNTFILDELEIAFNSLVEDGSIFKFDNSSLYFFKEKTNKLYAGVRPDL